jgi:hypothetical protein
LSTYRATFKLMTILSPFPLFKSGPQNHLSAQL